MEKAKYSKGTNKKLFCQIFLNTWSAIILSIFSQYLRDDVHKKLKLNYLLIHNMLIRDKHNMLFIHVFLRAVKVTPPPSVERGTNYNFVLYSARAR